LELQQKLDEVRDYLKDKRVVVAFSGGADSTLLAKLAFESAPEAVAVTVDSGVLPKNFTDKAHKIAEEIGIPHEVLMENFLKMSHSARIRPKDVIYVKIRCTPYSSNMQRTRVSMQ